MYPLLDRPQPFRQRRCAELQSVGAETRCRHERGLPSPPGNGALGAPAPYVVQVLEYDGGDSRGINFFEAADGTTRLEQLVEARDVAAGAAGLVAPGRCVLISRQVPGLERVVPGHARWRRPE